MNRVTNISQSVMELAKDMQFKLDKNKHKACDMMNADGKGRGWEHCEYGWLSSRIEDEMHELNDALVTYLKDKSNPNADAVLKECADVANFAMMIHDNVRRETPSEETSNGKD